MISASGVLVLGSSCVAIGWSIIFRPQTRVECVGPNLAIYAKVLGVLQEQLQRCGPESLGARPCPSCPQVMLADNPWWLLERFRADGSCRGSTL